MSKLLCLVFFFSLFYSCSLIKLRHDLGDELISNGDFSRNAGSWKYQEVEVNEGTIYNKSWTTGPIAELDVNNNQKLSQNWTYLQEGMKCTISLQYAARENAPSLQTCSFKVNWNGETVEEIVPKDHNINNYSHEVTTIAGINTLELEGSGPSDGYGATVDNVSLKCIPVPLHYEEGKEYLRNGSFDIPDQSGLKAAWRGEEVHIEWGLHKSLVMNTDYALALNSNRINSIVTQKFYVDQAGEYVLEFDTAAQHETKFETNELVVKFNDKEIFRYVPQDYKRNTHKIEGLMGIEGENKVTFEAAGLADDHGILVDNVTLKANKSKEAIIENGPEITPNVIVDPAPEITPNVIVDPAPEITPNVIVDPAPNPTPNLIVDPAPNPTPNIIVDPAPQPTPKPFTISDSCE